MDLIVMKENAWYPVLDADTIDSPALMLYPSRMKENIRLLKSMIDDPLRLRPHVKTHKTREAVVMMMAEGIQKFKCATLAEMEMLGMANAPDVLLAYQPVGPKLQRFISLLQHYPRTLFSCLVDNLETASNISMMAAKEKLVIPVYIDLNVGMNRTGIVPGEKAIELYQCCKLLDGIMPVGLHFYDGHIRDKDIEKRRIACNKVLAEVESIREEIKQPECNKPDLIAGGSPSFPIYADAGDIECSPGTFILWDKGYSDSLPDQNFLHAAVVITRIISLPDERKLCLDLGYKSIASENTLTNRVHFLNAPDLTIVSHSEEHMVVETPVPHSWEIGDLLYALPVHICPTCAMYETAHIVEEGVVTGTWQIIARDRKINF
ncbi:MAG: D-TA family PLP-dependent enzyme [Bacteroidota bacterium]